MAPFTYRVFGLNVNVGSLIDVRAARLDKSESCTQRSYYVRVAYLALDGEHARVPPPHDAANLAKASLALLASVRPLPGRRALVLHDGGGRGPFGLEKAECFEGEGPRGAFIVLHFFKGTREARGVGWNDTSVGG